jgi:aminoglycoside phosphotransferase (APT) family kinase protein
MSVDKRAEMRKVAEGREAEMFEWEEGRLLRLMRDPGTQTRNEWQAAAMEAARSQGVRVPAVYGLTTVMGRPGIVMERIQGTDLLTLIGRRPWTVFRAGRISGEVHARLHGVQAPAATPPLRAMLRQRIELEGRLPPHLAAFALGVLDGLPDGDSLCHGDFHPGNILMDGETPVLIDWTNAARGEGTADVARTRMMLRLGSAPPGTSLLLRGMALFGRNILVWLYMRSYRRSRPLEMDAVRRWTVPVVAARLSEGIEEEVPALLRLLEGERAKAGQA